MYLASPFGSGQGAGQERLLAITATLPTVGVFARGEVLFNRSPTAGGPVGWVCTTGGCLGFANWTSGTTYLPPPFSGHSYTAYVQHAGNFYRMIAGATYDPNPVPTTTAYFTLKLPNPYPTDNRVARAFSFEIELKNVPMASGRTASVSLAPSLGQTLVDGVDYTPTMEVALANATLPQGVTRSGPTLTFGSTYIGGKITLSFTTVAKTPDGVVDTVIPHLHTPVISGGGGTPTIAIYNNDQVIRVSDFNYNLFIVHNQPNVVEELSGTFGFAWFGVSVQEIIPLGVTISCDIEADPSMTATEGVDFTPTIAEALAAVVLPAGVTRVGNRFSWSPVSSPPTAIPQFLIKFNRVDDALIEAVEKIALRLTNPAIAGAGASTLGLSMPSASINIIENKVSTVPPTHTSGDVMYPEPDPANPGEFLPGFTWRYLGNTAPVWSPFGNSVLEGTAVYNPASMAAGAVDAVQTVAVTGAALGDLVEASFTVNRAGAVLDAWVSVPNTVSFQFRNPTAGVIDLASGTVKCRVRK